MFLLHFIAFALVLVFFLFVLLHLRFVAFLCSVVFAFHCVGIQSHVHTTLQGSNNSHIPYSGKYWRGIKFGGLAVLEASRQIKIGQYIVN